MTGTGDLTQQIRDLRLLVEKAKKDEVIHLQTIETLTGEIERLRRELEESERARETLQQELKWAVSRIREAKKAADVPASIKEKISEMQRRIKAITIDVDEKEREIHLLKNMIAERDRAIATLRSRNEELETTVHRLMEEIQGLRQRFSGLETASSAPSGGTGDDRAIVAEIEALREKVRKYSVSYVEMKERAKTLARDLKAARTQLEKLKNGERSTDTIVLNLAPPLSGGRRTCDLCEGRKMVIVQDRRLEREVPCPRCGGTGRV